jgi:hypothetical protein
MYKVVETQKDKGSTVTCLKHPIGIPLIIYLDLANQKELKYLFEIQHPFVYKEEPKEKKPKPVKAK